MTSSFGADSVAELLLFMATELFQMDRPQESDKDNVEDQAKKLVGLFRQGFSRLNNRRHSPIASAGLEVDLAKCYLTKMTIEDTVKWLLKERNFKTSKSAVARYWNRLAQLPYAQK